jgi:predicted RNA polymerase sigma factor
MTQMVAAARATRTLLARGVVAGPLYVLVSLTEALTRDGSDLARHQWSLLRNGDLKLGRLDEARQAFQRAATLTGNRRERALFLDRASRLRTGTLHPLTALQRSG